LDLYLIVGYVDEESAIEFVKNLWMCVIISF
jgi:hypothetical protein